MNQYIGKLVKYTGETSETLVKDEMYIVSHMYRGNLAVYLRQDNNTLTIVSCSKGNFFIVNDPNSEINVHSVLTYEGEPVAVRFTDLTDVMYDVEIGSIKGLDNNLLTGFEKDALVEDGDLLVTEEELNTKQEVIDRSDDSFFCNNIRFLFGLE